MKSTNLYYL